MSKQVFSFFGGISMAAAALVSAPAMAQEAGDAAAEEQSSETDSRIVVRGRPTDVTRAQAHRQARDIAVIGDIYDEPLARFEQPVCPGIMGMQREMAELMVTRIRDNARYLDLEVQPDGCRANLIVVFTQDGRAELEEIMDRSPELFVETNAYDRRRLLEPGPTRVWTQTDYRTRDGMPVYGDRRNRASVPTVGGWMAHSRIYTTLRNDITSVMVFIDRDATDGLSVGQLADYATMRGLVQTKPSKDPYMDSILEIFNPDGASPSRLTDFDRAYLRAVYDWIPNLPAAAKLGGINRELREIAREAAAAEEADPTNQ